MKKEIAKPAYRVIKDLVYLSKYFYRSLTNNGNFVKDGVTLDLTNSGLSWRKKSRIFRKGIERSERKIVKNKIDKEVPVIELGAGIGFVSVSIDKVLKRRVSHVAIEANKRIIPTLKKTKKLNRSYFSIINKAYDASRKKVDFHVSRDFLSSSVSKKNKKRTVQVSAISLDKLINDKNISNFQLVCDIEGGEYDLFEEEIDIISKNCKLILVEFHKKQSVDTKKYVRCIVSNGFKLDKKIGRVYAFEKK